MSPSRCRRSGGRSAGASYAEGHGRGRTATFSGAPARRRTGAARGRARLAGHVRQPRRAFLVDAFASALVAGLFTAPDLPGNWSLVSFGLITVGTLVVFGQTPGMRLLGLRLAHPQAGQRLALWRAVVRTALLVLLVPALVVDADGRGLHDRLTSTAVVRNR